MASDPTVYTYVYDGFRTALCFEARATTGGFCHEIQVDPVNGVEPLDLLRRYIGCRWVGVLLEFRNDDDKLLVLWGDDEALCGPKEKRPPLNLHFTPTYNFFGTCVMTGMDETTGCEQNCLMKDWERSAVYRELCAARKA